MADPAAWHPEDRVGLNSRLTDPQTRPRADGVRIIDELGARDRTGRRAWSGRRVIQQH